MASSTTSAKVSSKRDVIIIGGPVKEPAKSMSEHQRIEPTVQTPSANQEGGTKTTDKTTERKGPTASAPDQAQLLENVIRASIEYSFSDVGLTQDRFLLARMAEDPEGWVNVNVLANLPKVKHLCQDTQVLTQALKKSSFLTMDASGTKVRRPNYTPPKPKRNKDLRRTVFVYGILESYDEAALRELLGTFGFIAKVFFDSEVGGPDKDIGQIIMRRKFKPKTSDGQPVKKP